MRVLLLDDIVSCQVAFDEGFDVMDTRGGQRLGEYGPTPRLTVQFVNDRIELVELEREFAEQSIELVPHGLKPVYLGTAKGTRQFRGVLRLIREASAAGSLVNVVGIEDYLVSVVSAEMPADFHEQALRAQAIAARTYALYAQQSGGGRRDWDVLATEGSQMYVGVDVPKRAQPAERAVRGTRGLVCTWASPDGERIFCTFYSSTCGGSSQDASPVRNQPPIPPLAGGVACDYCRKSPNYRWGPLRISKAMILQRLRDKYPAFRALDDVATMEVVDRTRQARPVRFALSDGEHRAEIIAENFRLVVDPSGRELKSTFFEPVVEEDAIVFLDGRGFGHGMGMCQYGADGLARTGQTAQQILAFYYPASHVTRAY
jgi:stage II sporulation protein D